MRTRWLETGVDGKIEQLLFVQRASVIINLSLSLELGNYRFEQIKCTAYIRCRRRYTVVMLAQIEQNKHDIC